MESTVQGISGMQYTLAEHRRPSRPGRREKLSLTRQILRRCFPHSFFSRTLHFQGTPARRFLVRMLLTLLALLTAILCFLLYHLLIAENATVAKYLHLTEVNRGAPEKRAFMSLESTRPEDARALKDSLTTFVPRTKGPAPRLRKNGFLTTYFDVGERALPTLTKAALEAWFDPHAPLADVTEDVLLQHAWANTSFAATNDQKADNDFFHLLAFLYPPAQQQRYYRTALNDILGFGTRVGGTKRDPLLHHLLDEGLGRGTYDAAQRTYRNPVHLSKKGVALLERAAAEWLSEPPLLSSSSPTAADVTHRVAGWRWSLQWDNFSASIPIAVKGQSSPPATVTLQNLVFQFPGGSQFRLKRAALDKPHDVFVGREAKALEGLKELRRGLFPDEFHELDAAAEVYSQESFLSPGKPVMKDLSIPKMLRGVPGTKAEINTAGRAVPLKPSLSARNAVPVSRQPIQHAVYAAHWDSMRSTDFRFLGACDSAVPMVYLLRTMRNIAVLTDVAEVLAASYVEERDGAVDGNNNENGGTIIPGRTATFRESTTEAEVRARLATLLSPAHHALLYQYVFARPYEIGGNLPLSPGDATLNYPHKVRVDVRMWLDWAQHLPALSFIFFDAEEAFKAWDGDDNTYGARHLAQRWRAVTTTVQTRYSGGPQSLFDTVDLFALYDLMGTAGTSFHNFFPTQSGIYYAALAQKEAEKRQRAFHDASTITAELLWRVMGGTNTTKEDQKVDGYVRQLGDSVDVAIAALAQQHVTNVLATPSARPSQAALPRSWLLYGTPHEMLTLHRISLLEFKRTYSGMGALASLRSYDAVDADLVKREDFDPYKYLLTSNENIFFSFASVPLLRRLFTDPVIADDHLHWLDTQRVLHLISSPFPKSWHTDFDDGRDIHDGTTVDLANVLWSTIMELGHYWTGENGTA